ncbi:MAG: NADH-quinone oxidoreductase subunit J [Actinobacteria bacterium]|nr:NADH-quinone oxidoreductase subunit J [Actinomycetota bacterium]
MSPEQLIFWVLAPVSVAAAIGMVLSRNAIHSALFLVVNFVSIAVFYLVLGSPFLFVVQIAVYAGAIMVLFLFVIMLLGVDRSESLYENIRGHRVLSVVLVVGVLLEIITAIRLGMGVGSVGAQGWEAVNKGGNPQALARVLFSDYFLPFEVTSILLIVAAVAAMVMTRQRLKSVPSASDASQDEEVAA